MPSKYIKKGQSRKRFVGEKMSRNASKNPNRYDFNGMSKQLRKLLEEKPGVLRVGLSGAYKNI